MTRNHLATLFVSLCAFGFTAQALPKVGSVTISSQSGTLCATTAGSVTYQITVNRGNTPQSSGQFIADLSIVSGLPAGASYVFSPASLLFRPGTQSMAAVLTITTTAATPGGTHAFTVRAQNRAIQGDFALTNGSLVLGAPAVFTLCPADLIIPADASTCGALVGYDIAVTGIPTPTVSYQFTGATAGSGSGDGSGSFFNCGTTIVTLTAVNSCQPAAICEFTVTVNDEEAPTIYGPGDLYLSACQSSIELPEPTVYDNCGATFTSSHDSPLFLDYGQSVVVTYTATDGAGNASSYAFTVSRADELVVDAGADAHSYFGYAPLEIVDRAAAVSGGREPYTYSWSLSRVLICNQTNDAGDESFSGGDCANNTCPAFPDNDLIETPFCAGSAEISARLMADAEVCITVTDADGCVAGDCFVIHAGDVRCFAGNSGNAKVAVCHLTQSPKNPCRSICIHPDAVPEHLGHGDALGNCTVACEGSYKYDETAVDHTDEAQVYPNPTTGLLNISFFAHSDGNADFLVTNLLGQVVYTAGIPVTAGHQTHAIDMSGLAGIYRVQLQQGDESQEWMIMVTE
jgi:hypothetical protein